ncbi:acyl-CoA dehydrogenase [uncultured Parvibaculum sp.]|uniref:acyl-CoA dehydrogenase n=1 Tax=uncultured Parvibaculum sp. TaxID=291828 RepID=UPI0030DDBFDC
MITSSLRQRLVSAPLLGFVRRVLPPISETERAALDAGTVWWDAELFSGNPDWSRLLSAPPGVLSGREQSFLDNETEELCGMLDDWRISTDLALPDDAWTFMRDKGFFGMIIPTEYGGLGFSAAAQSAVVVKLSTRSITAAVTVMVPNSLGPGELLMMYGTDSQKKRYLEPLARGQEIPCFALTSPVAGSDAASMEDEGIVCHGEIDGRQALGIRLNFSKRYITLAPVATVMGLAFKLRDPDGLLGDDVERGITVALIPTDTAGVKIGRRHFPSMLAFANGPIEGKDVFIPLDWVIGGPARVGDGWRMLMGALAAGRGISLPALSTGGAQFAAYTTGAYARIREQFGLPIGRFEGVQEALARIGSVAYELEAARRLTCQAIDAGEKPAVISAIMKYHATERMRAAVNDAMDVHGGKGICEGPKNYLGSAYRAIPIGITVEGANILTRSLIVFGQGAIRCHPYLLTEMEAAQDEDKLRGLKTFDSVIFKHVGHVVATLGRATLRALTAGRSASVPDAGPLTADVRRLARYSAALALVSEVTLISLGGALKRMENLSARLGDVLSELYISSAVVARYEHDGRQSADLPFARLSLESSFRRIEQSLDRFLANFPNRLLAIAMRAVIFPYGVRRRAPSDALAAECAEILLAPSSARDRLTGGIYRPRGNDEVAMLDRAFIQVDQSAAVRQRQRKGEALSAAETAALEETDRLVRMVIGVDDFDPDALTITARSAQFDATPQRRVV